MLSRPGGVIISLTSFPARINKVWQVIECMKRQSLQPMKIILWLSKDQFPNEQNIPESLKEREDDEFEIRLVDGDIRSHKKYYYVAKEYPNSLVFLIDDDIYYPTDILERSLQQYNKSGNSIICNYGYKIMRNADGNRKRYSEWEPLYSHTESESLFFGSGGGTLLNPSKLYYDLTNIDLALKLCPLADDIWLNVMAKLAGLKIKLLNNGLIMPIISKNDTTLSSVNNGQDKNEEQLKAVEAYYGKIF